MELIFVLGNINALPHLISPKLPKFLLFTFYSWDIKRIEKVRFRTRVQTLMIWGPVTYPEDIS